ncbi:MAG TPA: hypothetical protein VE085_10935 [Burkholderiales bacterium]|nr:hypothetical protein [Burkholderiales bacterium]
MRIKGQADIDIYITDTGYICLKQKDELDGERLIEFAPAYGQKVAGAIASLQEFAQAKFEKAELAEVE